MSSQKLLQVHLIERAYGHGTQVFRKYLLTQHSAIINKASKRKYHSQRFCHPHKFNASLLRLGDHLTKIIKHHQ